MGKKLSDRGGRHAFRTGKEFRYSDDFKRALRERERRKTEQS